MGPILGNYYAVETRNEMRIDGIDTCNHLKLTYICNLLVSFEFLSIQKSIIYRESLLTPINASICQCHLQYFLIAIIFTPNLILILFIWIIHLQYKTNKALCLNIYSLSNSVLDGYYKRGNIYYLYIQ